MKISTLKASTLSFALAAGLLAAGQAGAAAISLPNGDFEAGNLSGWSTIGTVVATPSTTVTTFDSTVWTIGAAGTTMAQLFSNPTSVSTIESTLGITAGSLGALNTNPDGGALTDGSALYRSFSATAGDTISFAWDYVATDYIPFNDPAFAILIGPGGTSIDVLASTHGLGIPVGTSGHSGWQTYTATLGLTGDYTLAFVTTNDKDTVLDSVLFIDNAPGTCNPTCPPSVTSVPEPGSMALIGIGLAGFGAARRRKTS